MKHKIESRLPGEISVTSDMQMTPPLWQKVKRNDGVSWWKWKRRVKCWFKSQHSDKIMASSPINSWQIDVEIFKTVKAFILGSYKITTDGDCCHEIKTLAPWKKSYDPPRQQIKKQILMVFYTNSEFFDIWSKLVIKLWITHLHLRRATWISLEWSKISEKHVKWVGFKSNLLSEKSSLIAIQW